MLAHKLAKRLSDVRKKRIVDFFRPDGKSQVTIRYDEKNQPIAIDAVVISTQHSESVKYKTLREVVMEEVIKPVLPGRLVSSKTKYFINPTGRFVVGGPMGDSGLTGRKIIVDTYGGMGRHGGGAFSGKDPSKVDRSACYYARYIAKNVVAAGLARRCEVQLAYAIGVAQPVSLLVQTFGTGALPDDRLSELVQANFDARPGALIRELDLRRPISARPLPTVTSVAATPSSPGSALTGPRGCVTPPRITTLQASRPARPNAQARMAPHAPTGLALTRSKRSRFHRFDHLCGRAPCFEANLRARQDVVQGQPSGMEGDQQESSQVRDQDHGCQRNVQRRQRELRQGQTGQAKGHPLVAIKKIDDHGQHCPSQGAPGKAQEAKQRRLPRNPTSRRIFDADAEQPLSRGLPEQAVEKDEICNRHRNHPQPGEIPHHRQQNCVDGQSDPARAKTG